VFDQLPAESERRSWLWVALWSASIFAAVPMARLAEGWVREHLGQAAFGWFVLGAVGAAFALAVRARLRAARAAARVNRGSLVWLTLVAAAFAAGTASLWSNPEEAMHFVQYGVLSLLLHRALAHRLRDRSIYPAAVLGCVFVGGLEELIQWITPQRYFGLRDVALDGLGGALAQLGLAKGVAPPYVRRTFEPRGLRVVVRLALLVWALLFACMLNTPARVDRYASRVDGLGFLATNPSVMIEYGYRYFDPEVGVFRSRLTPAALARTDRERGAEVGRIVAEDQGSYEEFLARHPAQRDPYAHEFRVHLFSRDHNVRLLQARPEDLHAALRSLSIVREDRLLRRYFPEAFRAAGASLAPGVQQFFERRTDDRDAYDSRVSAGLVTQFREWQLVLGFVAGFAALFAAARWIGPGASPNTS